MMNKQPKEEFCYPRGKVVIIGSDCLTCNESNCIEKKKIKIENFVKE